MSSQKCLVLLRHLSCDISLTSITPRSKKIHVEIFEGHQEAAKKRIRRTLEFDDPGEIGIDIIFRKTMKYHMRRNRALE